MNGTQVIVMTGRSFMNGTQVIVMTGRSFWLDG